eukprot:5080597-Prymnesium_polylepis.1
MRFSLVYHLLRLWTLRPCADPAGCHRAGRRHRCRDLDNTGGPHPEPTAPIAIVISAGLKDVERTPHAYV